MASNAKIIGDLIAADSSVAIPGDGVILASDLADGSVTTAKLADANVTIGKIATTVPLGTKNIIINGDMRIAQRGTSTASITSGGYYTVDRFAWSPNTMGTWTMNQDTDVPSGQGFANSLKLQCTTADASPAASDFLLLSQAFEGQNLQYLKKGTASAQSLTLSFWIKAYATGTFIIELVDGDNIRSISKSFTIDSAGTWEKKTLTFAGDTTGTLDNDNNNSLSVYFWMGAGSDFTTGTLQTSWGTLTGVNRAVGVSNLAASTSHYFNVTGVQLEVGDTATPFENRMYGTELALCQRYYQVIEAGVNAYSSTGIVGFSLNTAMRATPTLTFSYSGTANRVYRIDTGGTSDLTVAATALTDKSFISLFATSPAGWASAAGVGFRSTFVFSAEL